MPEKKFELGDYVEVKDRIKLFYELFGQGRLVTSEVLLSSEPDGKPRVMVKALAYRTPDDPQPGVGHSWIELPGSTPYTRGSELENAETSAWGRAIGSLGILIDRSIATSNEIDNKKGEAPVDRNGAAPPLIEPNVETEELVGDLKRAGMVRVGSGNGYKLEARQGPDGHVIGFKLETDKGGIPQVVVAGEAGEALFLATSLNPAAMLNTRVTVKGRLFNVKRPGSRSYHRLHVSEWEWDEYRFPVSDEPPLEEPPEEIPLFGEKVPA